MAPGPTSIYGITIEAPASTKCQLFHLPPEIRLQIYGYLLKSRCFLESDTSYNSRKKSDSEFDREAFYAKLEEKIYDLNKSDWNTVGQGGNMYPEILQTNRAIYSEAAPLLYTKTTIDLQTCDIVCLSEGSSDFDFVRWKPRVWRRNPLRGKGRRNAKGEEVYASDAMDGDIEPHVFARFQRLSVDAWFSSDNDYVESRLRIDRKGRFAVEDEVRFGATIRQSTVIRDLASLLSNSTFINSLEVGLRFDLAPGYEFGPEPLTEEEEALQTEEDFRLIEATNDRAVEIFLDSNMLAPLGTLSNVKTFGLRVHKTSQPQSHHLKMIQDLKDKIERRWKLSQAAKDSWDQSFQLASTKNQVAA